jgi:hypothetical protein
MSEKIQQRPGVSFQVWHDTLNEDAEGGSVAAPPESPQLISHDDVMVVENFLNTVRQAAVDSRDSDDDGEARLRAIDDFYRLVMPSVRKVAAVSAEIFLLERLLGITGDKKPR